MWNGDYPRNPTGRSGGRSPPPRGRPLVHGCWRVGDNARIGHGLAQHNLGNIYFEGRGVAQNDSHAVHWWTLAAEEGDAIPQLRLGIMYAVLQRFGRRLAQGRD